APDWEQLVAPLEELDDRLERVWAPGSHLNSVTSAPAWREAHEAALPLLTAYQTELGQDRRLYQAYQALADSPPYTGLDTARRAVIDHTLRDFRLSGVALEEPARSRYGELRQELPELGMRCANNVLDATQGWFRHITDV